VIDKLLKQYWVNHLAVSPFFSNLQYYQENEEEVKKCARHICRKEQIVHMDTIKRKDATLKKMVNLTIEKNQALLGEAIKNILF